MTTQGLIGFHYQGTDKLVYNQADSHPDTLGLKVLRELRLVDNWDTVRKRIDALTPIPESRKLNDLDGIVSSEIRRHFPDLKYRFEPKDYYQLMQPLQGTLKPYLDGKLSFMPDARDFIHDSLHCDWAYIANLDRGELEVWKGNQIEPDHEDNRYAAEPNRYGNKANTMKKGVSPII
ncbi:MAG: hypothetical protein V3V05_06250 [Pontiella sp.]